MKNNTIILTKINQKIWVGGHLWILWTKIKIFWLSSHQHTFVRVRSAVRN
jgi:hypothetical protein